jgi:tetratricopeptide (TPR) repeat protein
VSHAGAARAGGRRALVLSAALLALMTLMAAPRRSQAGGAADEENAEARRRFKHGTKLFDEAKFLEAAHEFEEGYAIAPRPGFLLNIAHSYRRAGDLKQSRRYYELFLSQERDTAQRVEVAGYLKSLDDALAEQSAGDSPKDAQTIHEAPPPAPPPLVRAPLGRPPGADDEGSARRRRWLPWLVAGAAAALAGGLAIALARPESHGACGTLGCFDER